MVGQRLSLLVGDRHLPMTGIGGGQRQCPGGLVLADDQRQPGDDRSSAGQLAGRKLTTPPIISRRIDLVGLIGGPRAARGSLSE